MTKTLQKRGRQGGELNAITAFIPCTLLCCVVLVSSETLGAVDFDKMITRDMVDALYAEHRTALNSAAARDAEVERCQPPPKMDWMGLN